MIHSHIESCKNIEVTSLSLPPCCNHIAIKGWVIPERLGLNMQFNKISNYFVYILL